MSGKSAWILCFAAAVVLVSAAWSLGDSKKLPDIFPVPEPPDAARITLILRAPKDSDLSTLRTETGIRLFLTSRAIERRMLKEFQADGMPAKQQEEFLDTLRNKTRFEFPAAAEGSTIVVIGVKSKDPESAAKLLNVLADAAKEALEEARQATVERRMRVLEQRIQDVERSMEDCMNKMRQYLTDRPMLAFDDPVTVRARYQQVLADTDQCRRRQTEAKALVEKLEPLKKSAPSAAVDVELARAQAQLDAATKDLDALEQRRDEEEKNAVFFAKEWLGYDTLRKRYDLYAGIAADLTRAVEKVKTDLEYEESNLQVLQKSEAPPPAGEK